VTNSPLAQLPDAAKGLEVMVLFAGRLFTVAAAVFTTSGRPVVDENGEVLDGAEAPPAESIS
jgi:hypothetical protein